MVKSVQDYGITLRGPTRPDVSWQVQVEGAYRPDDFAINWEQQWARCPQGKQSISWTERVDSHERPFIQVQFGVPGVIGSFFTVVRMAEMIIF